MRYLIFAAGLLALALGGLQAGSRALIGEAAAAPLKVSTTKCTEDWNTPTGATSEFPIQAESPAGAAMFGDPKSVTCAAPAGGKTICQAKGPTRMVFAVQDYWYVKVPAGRTATVTVSDAKQTCFLNE